MKHHRRYMQMNNYKEEFEEYLKGKKVFNSHSHHMVDSEYKDMSLSKVLETSYCTWMAAVPQNAEELENYILRFGTNSYFRWLFKAIEELYHIPFKAENYDALNEAIAKAHQQENWHLQILTDYCHYEKIIIDHFPNPGYDLGHPELFQPTLRCNMFACCSNATDLDHNGNNPFTYLGRVITDFDEYCQEIQKKIQQYKSIKLALAYDYGNDILCFDKERALKAFHNLNATATEKKDYYDYMSYLVCQMAGECGVVVQIHTGLGTLNRTAPIYLRKLIEACPEAIFDLFHGGFPWMDDLLALLHNYPNVVADTCWLPLISTESSRQFLRNILEVGDCHRILWGCDSFAAEESYGAWLAGLEMLSSVLADMTTEGVISKDYAFYIADRIWCENGKKFFG